MMVQQQLLTITVVSDRTKLHPQTLRAWDRKHKNNQPIRGPHILPVATNGRTRKI